MLALTHKDKEGMMQEKEIVGERRLWAAVVSSGIQDLRSVPTKSSNPNSHPNQLESDAIVLKAALYFFTEDEGEDKLNTFDGVCRAHNIDSNKAAKRIWEKLKPSRQERIKNLIRESGDESRVH